MLCRRLGDNYLIPIAGIWLGVNYLIPRVVTSVRKEARVCWLEARDCRKMARG